MTTERLSYTFGPLERHGLLGAIRGRQAAILSLGALLAIAVLDKAPSVTGAVGGALALGSALALALAPVGRRTVEEWAPIAASLAVRRLRGTARFRSESPTHGCFVSRSERRRTAMSAPSAHPPPALRDVRLLEAEHRGQRVGILSSGRGRSVGMPSHGVLAA